ncbi:uncharacterized protein C8Q71DRAFT_379755 [Rhodofomes roseus]|uniref:Uncharacterized protein n=1 Tax=Rhodofomes roseus TaxID=34475 RepID=A0ABQ8K0F7_9APHY|nr:uncharacterized protein C8Q71DRAFT_379755 [Rhodofomes roseus]KAH9830138.1 hypothetical protein C8Q71DRAFT_379755 [Rhodofomes roseus]
MYRSTQAYDGWTKASRRAHSHPSASPTMQASSKNPSEPHSQIHPLRACDNRNPASTLGSVAPRSCASNIQHRARRTFYDGNALVARVQARRRHSAAPALMHPITCSVACDPAGRRGATRSALRRMPSDKASRFFRQAAYTRLWQCICCALRRHLRGISTCTHQNSRLPYHGRNGPNGITIAQRLSGYWDTNTTTRPASSVC